MVPLGPVMLGEEVKAMQPHRKFSITTPSSHLPHGAPVEAVTNLTMKEVGEVVAFSSMWKMGILHWMEASLLTVYQARFVCCSFSLNFGFTTVVSAR